MPSPAFPVLWHPAVCQVGRRPAVCCSGTCPCRPTLIDAGGRLLWSGSCGNFSIVRRDLTTVAVIGALLWAVSGVSVLALILHQHGHHSDAHGDHDVLQTAVHAHAHEGSPDHYHGLIGATLSIQGIVAFRV